MNLCMYTFGMKHWYYILVVPSCRKQIYYSEESYGTLHVQKLSLNCIF